MTFDASDALVGLVFCLTYLAMAVGRVPGLAIDRVGLTLSGLAVLLVAGAVSLDRLAAAIELPTLSMLFALMLVAAHFEYAGGFDGLAHRLTRLDASPRALLALVIAAAGLLSAVLVNDIVVFAFAPMLCQGLRRRALDPRPYLLGLAGAANAGSAATLIGNPQNILIGQVGALDFLGYTRVAAVPAAVALGVVYAVIAYCWRGALTDTGTRCALGEPPALDYRLIARNALAVGVLIGLLACVDHRAVAALGVAAILLWGRVPTRRLLAGVDGALLVMIGCLFAITAAATALPEAAEAVRWLRTNGVLAFELAPLAVFAVAASNTIGNVPAVVLLLKVVPDMPSNALYGLALFSTLSGNLLLTGSLANIIVAERAARHGVRLSFVDFARVGIPITLLSMGMAAAWLWMLGLLRA